MNGVLLMVVAAAVLACGYLGYGRWLANKWGVDKEALTPAKRMKDGKSLCPSPPSPRSRTSSARSAVLALSRVRSSPWPWLAACRALGPHRRHLWRRPRLWVPCTLR